MKNSRSGNRAFVVSLFFAIAAAIASCDTSDGRIGSDTRRDQPKLLSKTLLSNYREKTTGGFSHAHIAYVRRDDGKVFVDLNDKEIGPFEAISERFFFSLDGEQIVFAAKSDDKWWVVLNGEPVWSYDRFSWPWQSWSTDIGGRMFRPQTRAVPFAFSADGSKIAYSVTIDERWSVATSGKPGPTYSSVESAPIFVGQRLEYTAWENDKPVQIVGDAKLGPFDSVWRTRVSSDGSHSGFIAELAGKRRLYVDGDLIGEAEPDSFEVGPDGSWAYQATTPSGSEVHFEQVTMGPFGRVEQLTFSDDGSALAFFAKSQGKWELVVSDGRRFDAGDGYYILRSRGRDYSIMWGRGNENIAYFVRDGQERALMVDGRSVPMPTIDGIAISVITDGSDRIGVELMAGPYIDSRAFATALGDPSVECADPLSARSVGTKIYCESSTGPAPVVTGDEIEIGEGEKSEVIGSPTGAHFAYFSTENGQLYPVLDDHSMPESFEKVFKAGFVTEDEFAFVGLINGELHGVRYGL